MPNEAHQQRVDDFVCRIYSVDEIPDGGWRAPWHGSGGSLREPSKSQGPQYPYCGEALVALVEQLARFADNEHELNGFLVVQLTRLKAVEPAETIERASASNRAEEDIRGYWGTVRQELGATGLGLAPNEPPRPPRQVETPFHTERDQDMPFASRDVVQDRRGRLRELYPDRLATL